MNTRTGLKFAPGLLLTVYSPPRNCCHQVLPFVEAAAKAQLAGKYRNSTGRSFRGADFALSGAVIFVV
jgi:hypothetical protein